MKSSAPKSRIVSRALVFLPESARARNAKVSAPVPPVNWSAPEPADQPVVAVAAEKHVRAVAAVERVGAAVAGDDIRETVAGAGQGRVEERQVLDRGEIREAPADRRGDGVGAARVDDGVVLRAHHIGVVAEAARSGHRGRRRR